MSTIPVAYQSRVNPNVYTSIQATDKNRHPQEQYINYPQQVSSKQFANEQ